MGHYLFKSFQSEKEKRKQSKSTSVSLNSSSHQTQITDFNGGSKREQYYRGHPQQNMITSAILDIIVEDVIPTRIVEKPGFYIIAYVVLYMVTIYNTTYAII